MATRLVLSKADRKLQVWDFNGDNCEAFVKVRTYIEIEIFVITRRKPYEMTG